MAITVSTLLSCAVAPVVFAIVSASGVAAAPTTAPTSAAATVPTGPAANRPPLRPSAFVALPLGSVRPAGWLRTQLELQRAGLTGRAERALVEIDATSGWLGGPGENWEKGPYYVKGLIPLAYALDDAELKARAQKWVDWSLASQRPDGFYGPAKNDDWWPRMVTNYFLRDHHEATGDPRVIPFLAKYYAHMLAALPARPLRDWGRARAGDEMDTVLWLYNRTGDGSLLALVDLLRAQAYDWPTIFRDNTFQSFGLDFHPKHNVNVPQAAKMPAASWQRTGDPRERAAIDEGSAHLMRDHGTTLGIQSGTEFLAGRSSGQGVEFCSIVEQMLSDETVVRIFGDARHADRLERLAFNGLPAAWNRDLTGLQYYTVANEVIAKRGRQGFGQDYDNALMSGPRSGYPCCCFNVHMGWPKFLQNSWAATPDGGLAAIAYAPTTVTAKVAGGVDVRIVETTDYPFGEEVRFAVDPARPADFPIVVRIPAWCAEGAATIHVNGQPQPAPSPGEFATVRREWKAGDVMTVRLPMAVRAETGVHESVSLHRGPLTFALRVAGTPVKVGEPAPGFPEYEIAPDGPWNYALAIDPRDPAKSVELLVDDGSRPAANPFDQDASPVKLKAKARLLPGWGLAWNGVIAFDPPRSPVRSAEPLVDVTLLPFGAQDLRLTDFPVLGPVGDTARPQARTFAFDGPGADGWTWYGGGWHVERGALRAVPNGGAPGFKALLDDATYADVSIEADVTVPEAGDAGVMVRVTKPSIGADAFEGYYAGVTAQTGRVMLGRADGRAWHPIADAGRPLKAGDVVRLELSARGATLVVTIDGKPVVTADDATWKAGQVGVRTHVTDSDKSFGAFDHVRVTPRAAR